LAAAGSHGQIGPNLDRLRPSFAAVKTQVEQGGSGMPAFAGQLTPAQIRDVAAFVATRATP
jgi:mono/diheme cytochrome c family protein